MKQIVHIALTLMMVTSCKGQRDSFIETRLKTAEKFIDCLKNNSPDQIYNYTYRNDKIYDKEARDFYVNKAFKFIKKFGLPLKNAWIIEYNPENNFERLSIKVPLFKGYDSTFNLLKADIIIIFPPPQISDKISNYEIADEYDIKRTRIIAPSPHTN